MGSRPRTMTVRAQHFVKSGQTRQWRAAAKGARETTSNVPAPSVPYPADCIKRSRRVTGVETKYPVCSLLTTELLNHYQASDRCEYKRLKQPRVKNNKSKIKDYGHRIFVHIGYLSFFGCCTHFHSPSYNLLPQCLENDTNTQQAAKLVEMLQETLLPRKVQASVRLVLHVVNFVHMLANLMIERYFDFISRS